MQPKTNKAQKKNNKEQFKYQWKEENNFYTSSYQELLDSIKNGKNDTSQYEKALNMLKKVQGEWAILQISNKDNQIKLFHSDNINHHILIQPSCISFGQVLSNKNHKNIWGYAFQYHPAVQSKSLNLLYSNNLQHTWNYRTILTRYFGQKITNSISAKGYMLSYFIGKKDFSFGLGWNTSNKYLNAKTQGSKTQIVSEQQNNLLKDANKLSLLTIFKKPNFQFSGEFGTNLSNAEYFASLSFLYNKSFNFRNYDLNFSLEGGKVFGVNVSQDNYLNKNKKKWVGKVDNCVNPKIQFLIKNYPFLNFTKFSPYLYSSLWTTFSRNGQKYESFKKSVNASFDFEYGIGLKGGNSSGMMIQLEWSLLQLSRTKNGETFSSLKFNFQ